MSTGIRDVAILIVIILNVAGAVLNGIVIAFGEGDFFNVAAVSVNLIFLAYLYVIARQLP
jgi:hypothetical protein